MKKILTLLTLIAAFSLPAQNAEEFYKNGLNKLQSNQLDEAIDQFSECIKLQPENYYAWFNRAICKNRLKRYEQAIVDFDQVVKLNPAYKKSYVARSNTKRHLKDYSGSFNDCNVALSLDPDYPEAFYNRALIFELLNKKDSACLDFSKAFQLGLYAAKYKADSCSGTSNKHAIAALTKTAENEQYGFSEKQPVKVGVGPKGGPANQRIYLDLLRDAQGNPVTYERKGSCCDFPTKNSPLGIGLLDEYSITYHTEKGKKKTASVYLSFYDYEEPLILFGFKTVEQK